MSDSNARDRLDEKHDGTRQQRLEAVKRWADYIDSEPPETWGPNRTPSSTTNSTLLNRLGRRHPTVNT